MGAPRLDALRRSLGNWHLMHGRGRTPSSRATWTATSSRVGAAGRLVSCLCRQRPSAPLSAWQARPGTTPRSLSSALYVWQCGRSHGDHGGIGVGPSPWSIPSRCFTPCEKVGQVQPTFGSGPARWRACFLGATSSSTLATCRENGIPPIHRAEACASKLNLIHAAGEKAARSSRTWIAT